LRIFKDAILTVRGKNCLEKGSATAQVEMNKYWRTLVVCKSDGFRKKFG
jgi:hypothetical protein